MKTKKEKTNKKVDPPFIGPHEVKLEKWVGEKIIGRMQEYVQTFILGLVA